MLGGIVPVVTARLAVECAQQRPGGGTVRALEDACCLGAGEDPPVGGRQARDLRDPQPGLGVGESLARQRPRLAEVVAAPDAGAVPLAGRGGVERTGTPDRAPRGTPASRRRRARGPSSSCAPRCSRARSSPCGCRRVGLPGSSGPPERGGHETSKQETAHREETHRPGGERLCPTSLSRQLRRSRRSTAVAANAARRAEYGEGGCMAEGNLVDQAVLFARGGPRASRVWAQRFFVRAERGRCQLLRAT